MLNVEGPDQSTRESTLFDALMETWGCVNMIRTDQNNIPDIEDHNKNGREVLALVQVLCWSPPSWRANVLCLPEDRESQCCASTEDLGGPMSDSSSQIDW